MGSEDGLEAAALESGKRGEAEREAVAGDEAAAEERAEKGAGGEVALGHVAVGAAGDEVAIGIAAKTRARDNVVEHAQGAGQAALTVETTAAVAGENCATIFSGLKKVHSFQIFPVLRARHHAAGDFARERDLDLVALVTALADAQKTFSAEASQDVPHGAAGKARANGKSARGNSQHAVACQTTTTDKIEVDDAVGRGESKSGDEMVLDVGPKADGVG
jgi:hypothetical protein